MGSVSASHNLAIIIFFLFCCVLCSSAGDSITQGGWLEDNGSTLVSPDRTFELGFFTPQGSPLNTRYVGIWYRQLKEKVVVWVANRDRPLNGNNKTARFGIDKDGNLKAWDNNRRFPLFSVVVTSFSASSGRASSVVKLTDSGNLVLSDSISRKNLWESFHNPTDTFLPGMKMDENLTLTSWLRSDDPASGAYTFKLDSENQNQYNIIRVNSYVPYWSSKDSEGMPDEMTDAKLILSSNFGENFYNGSVKTLSYKYERLVMSSSGEIRYYRNRTRSPAWWAPRDRCSVSNACGKFGSCNANNAFMCKCLPGFKPISPNYWNAGNFSSGCTRKSSLCEEHSGKHTFLSLKMMKVQKPNLHLDVGKKSDSCRNACLTDCLCQAYAETNTLKCLTWRDDLKTLQEEYDYESYNLFVRVPISDIKSARNCEICGSNMISYPLSTGSKCGDPKYSNFECNITTGQVLFRGYRVTRINPETLTFVIQLKVADMKDANCSSLSFSAQIPQLNRPFHMTGVCNASKTDNSGSEMTLKSRVEIEISWDPPPEPACTSLANCKDWPNSICETRDGMRKCFCNENFKWNGSSLNCTQEHGYQKLSLAIVVGIPVAVALVAILGTIGCIAYLHKRTNTKRKEKKANQGFHLNYRESRVKHLIDSEQFKEDDKKGIDVPFFDFEDILAAKDNFSDANKLGQGGFGPVYKGKFPEGQEMAVKRLSRASGQGLKEYKNEVVLIAKLQHRNLVRLLGYCIEGDEKILLYEYMPNKSLDSFIFDPTLCMVLNWEKRFDIILGIARGLLYLHQDSRLKIIHRDLKTSNILLDDEMNPKISDFGLAKIFDSKQVEASTNRVVGTYGYMSPEYALDGYFSEKSDVFSFGVMVLEIISGKRNTRVYQSDRTLSLLGHAWKLLKEDKVLELMDQTLSETCNTNEFLRCVNVGLLCVQDDPSDRPTMAVAFVMLSSDTVRMPLPKQPAFVVKRDLSSTASSSSKPEASWNSEILASIEEGR